MLLSAHRFVQYDRTVKTIYFYSPREEYGCFSNFSPHGFSLDGKWWATSEHFFQAQKFVGTPAEEEVRTAPTPREAAARGRDRRRPLRSDWEEVKDEVMKRAISAKFRTHSKLRAILLETAEQKLVENAPHDAYWGCGSDRNGLNRLGQLLMELRAELQREAEA